MKIEDLEKFPILEESNKRIIYDLGDGTVIKAPKNYLGIQANLQEIMIYEDLIHYSKKENWIIPLAEILSYDEDYHWLHMKKYNTNISEELIDKAGQLSKYIPIMEIHPTNIGRDQQGQFVLLDYEGLHWSWIDRTVNHYHPYPQKRNLSEVC